MVHLPIRIIFNDFGLKLGFLGILFISNFQSPDFANDFSIEWYVVFILLFLVCILYHHVYPLFYVSLLEIDVPQ